MNMEMGQLSQDDIIPHGNPTEKCKDFFLNLFWQHFNMNLGENEISIFHHIREKPVNDIDNREIFLKPTRKQLILTNLYGTCELNPPFYENYYLIHTRSKIDYISHRLKINCLNKIKRHHSYNNETCIFYNTRDYTSDTTKRESYQPCHYQNISRFKNIYVRTF